MTVKVFFAIFLGKDRREAKMLLCLKHWKIDKSAY